MSRWISSMVDLVVDVTHALAYEMRALWDDWRAES